MAGSFCPSVALLRSLRASPLRRLCAEQALKPVATRGLHSSAVRRADEKSFKGQLYESVNQRLERERAEQERFAKARGESGRGRVAATTFALLATAGGCYYLGTLVPADGPATSTSPLSTCQPPKHNVAPANLEAAWTDLVEIVGKMHVSTDKHDRADHSGSDWSSYTTRADEQPFMVVFPNTTEEVSKIVKVCHSRKIPITAYSGGTSLEGHFSATRGGICIDFSRMDKIIKLHKDDLDVVVQPAVGWEHLNEELAEDGLFFPPDPGPGAKIGGMVGTGCSGTNAYRYGTMRDWVISLTVVLADGTIIKTRQRPRKSSAGYNLTGMFIGSEGTLGLVTEATLKVTVKPQSTSVAVASFPTIRDAAACVASVVEQGVPIAAIEILDDMQMKCINDSGSTSRSWKEVPTLFFKFGGTQAGVKEQIALVQKLAKTKGSKSFDFARNSDEAAELWSARKEALWSVMAKKRDDSDHVWTTDVAVPISKLPDIIEQTKDDMSKSGLLGTIVGHVGDGNFHGEYFVVDTICPH
jgi:D-lactate dehydrogenase (cytochrome)